MAVDAKPYSEVRSRQRLGPMDTVIFHEPDTGRDQRTKVTVTSFGGWDLPGPSAGDLEFTEERTETDWIDRKTNQAVTPPRATVNRSCTLDAPVASARTIFELYESLTDQTYGVRISADRRWVDFFMFDEDQYDIELSFRLERPLADLAPDKGQAEGRLVIPHGGPRVSNYGAPGIPTVKLTRSELLAGLDQPANMNLLNSVIQPVVQRLADARHLSARD